MTRIARTTCTMSVGTSGERPSLELARLPLPLPSAAVRLSGGGSGGLGCGGGSRCEPGGRLGGGLGDGPGAASDAAMDKGPADGPRRGPTGWLPVSESATGRNRGPRTCHRRGLKQHSSATPSWLSREVHRAGIGLQDENVICVIRHGTELGGMSIVSAAEPASVLSAWIGTSSSVSGVTVNVPAASTAKSTPNSGSAKTREIRRSRLG